MQNVAVLPNHMGNCQGGGNSSSKSGKTYQNLIIAVGETWFESSKNNIISQNEDMKDELFLSAF